MTERNGLRTERREEFLSADLRRLLKEKREEVFSQRAQSTQRKEKSFSNVLM